jgi:hypothetical protein
MQLMHEDCVQMHLRLQQDCASLEARTLFVAFTVSMLQAKYTARYVPSCYLSQKAIHVSFKMQCPTLTP